MNSGLKFPSESRSFSHSLQAFFMKFALSGLRGLITHLLQPTLETRCIPNKTWGNLLERLGGDDDTGCHCVSSDFDGIAIGIISSLNVESPQDARDGEE